ncbi:hypothetical protein M5689_014045 [Euphorbia peplus]|nr:hypothetical protein M5689_014045 [Euphorbia peplus]
MKIVTFNVNGLRQRVSQFGSLLKLLNSFDADIICFQETKLRRQELTADLAIADGYESFFSCTRTSEKGRTGYSGVATFCRVKSAFSSTEPALPVSAEEGFTGLVNGSKFGKDDMAVIAQGLEEFDKDELLKIDGEGRCIITDHGHFVLFNIYGPRADSDDSERIQFKLMFYKILQKRWESLLHQGRRIFVVGDLNIAPTALDRCDPGPDFEKNEFRRWLRSMLMESGGPFFDVFRAKHPDRREAYTCWPSNTGAEQFNYGTRIDHILCAGPCLHEKDDPQGHNFVTCHVKECDILTEYKRWKPGDTIRWKGGWGVKLEGSDHAPVYTSLVTTPDILQHSTPSLSSRYLPMIHGFQQTLVSVLMKRQAATQVQSYQIESSVSDEKVTINSCSESMKRSFDRSSIPCSSAANLCSVNEDTNGVILRRDDSTDETASRSLIMSQIEHINSMPLEISHGEAVLPNANDQPSNTNTQVEKSCSEHYELNSSAGSQDQDEVNDGPKEKEKNNIALMEWQRIQQLMQNTIPLCKGHKEPCVSRIVKKPGPTFGRRFYVCTRAEGPASNPEANCGFFKWASSKSRDKYKVFDEYNQEEIILTTKEKKMLRGMVKGLAPHLDFDHHPNYVDWVDPHGKHPLSNAPEPKGRFIPSKQEAKEVVHYIRKIREGKIKFGKPKEKPLFSLLWGDDSISAAERRHLSYIHAPKPKLPGHDESYNPPIEYIPTQEEINSYQLMDEEDRPQFIPQRFSSQRSIGAYENAINEMFERCLDLMLSLRIRRKKLNAGPEDLRPKLQSKKDLKPYPTSCYLEYKGHTGAVMSISVETSGQWIASGSTDGTVRVWEVDTGIYLKIWEFDEAVNSVAWNPLPELPILAISVGLDLFLVNTGLGSLEVQKNVTELLQINTPIASDVSGKGNAALDVSWIQDEKYGGIRLRHFKTISSVEWHRRGDYFCTLMPAGDSNAIHLHRLSTKLTQSLRFNLRGLPVAFAFHPKRSIFFVATKEKVRVYNLVKKNLIKTLEPRFRELSSIAIHPEGDNVLVGSRDGKCCWFDMEFSTKHYKLLKSHHKDVNKVTFHSKYPLFASCSEDCTAYVGHGMVYSDLNQNPLIVPLKVLRGHSSSNGRGVMDCKFHPNQPWLFTAGADSTIRLYCNSDLPE